MKRYKKPTPEAILTRQVRGILNAVGYFHYKAWQGLGSQPGVSDIIGLTKEGTFFALELKAPRGKATTEQQSFLDEVNRSGGIGLLVHTIDDVVFGLELQDRFIEYKGRKGPG